MYDDFKLIDEEKLLQLAKDYNNNVKVNVNEYANFEEKYNLFIKYLTWAKHYINNLMNISVNLGCYEILKKINEDLKTIIDKVNNIYEITEIKEFDNNFNDNFDANFKKININLISALRIIFDLIEVEDNIKITNSLKIIFNEIVDILQILNEIEIIKPKIISLFKKY